MRLRVLPSKSSLPRVGWQRPGYHECLVLPRPGVPQRFRGVVCVARPIQDFGQGGPVSYPTHVANIIPTNGQCCSGVPWLQGRETENKELLREVREEVREEEERERALALAPYRVGAPKQGVIGESRHSKRLRRDVFAAAKDPTRKPVLILGEDGLCKGNLAAVLHSCSLDNRHPMLAVDCGSLDPAGSLLLGGGSRRGLAGWMRHGGTLLLEHANRAPAGVVEEVLAQLKGPGCGCKGCCQGRDPGPRLVLTAAGPLPAELQQQCTIIKVAPLRARASDIGPLQYHLLRRLAKAKGLAKMTLTQAAVRRLQSYAFPNNIRELEGILERAAGSAAAVPAVPTAAAAAAAVAGVAGPSTAGSKEGDGAKPGAGAAVELRDDAFWFASQDQADTLHANISALPMALFQSDWWNEQLNFRVEAGAFVVLLAMLLLGPQDAEHNLGLNLVWDWWWPLIILSLPILGRMWCAVCPFMVTGMLLQQWKLAQGGRLSRWPKWGEALGPWIVYNLFAAILVWEEVWDLPNTANLTAWLLMGITGGAVAGSWLFERRFWCRYLCPVGGMNGLIAKLSITEMRGSQGVCSSNCNAQGVPCQLLSSSHHCPNNSHPSQLTDNHNCVVCMECLKACPNGSVEWRLRVPGLDLWTTHKPTAAEAALMFLLLGSVPLHHLSQLLQQAGIDPAAVLASQPAHMLASLAVLALPGALCWGADWAWQSALSILGMVGAANPQGQSYGRPDGTATTPAVAALLAASDRAVAPAASAAAQPSLPPFLWRCYAYAPLAWAALLAHYLQPMLGQGGHALQVAAATVELTGAGWPAFTVHPEVIALLQGTALLGGAGLSLLLNMKLSSAEGRAAPAAHLMPHTILTLLITTELWSLLLAAG